MITLVPEKVNFKISTTNIEVIYKERDVVKVKVKGLIRENFLNKSDYNLIELNFITVAELKCISLNFFESEYNNYNIIKKVYKNAYDEWLESGFHPDPGFYFIQNSKWLLDVNKKYDPMNRLNLRHYLINGYDSYAELLASSFEVIIL